MHSNSIPLYTEPLCVLELNYNEIVGGIQESDLLADILYSCKMIKHDLKDTVCNTTDVRDKNRILLDAVCAHLSSTPQDYAVFRKCALQIHPFLECLLPSGKTINFMIQLKGLFKH